MKEPRNFNSLLENDFEPLILHEKKELGYLKLFLYSEGALFCQMSGSGSALYALFSSGGEADSVKQKLEPKHRVFITPAGFQAGA